MRCHWRREHIGSCAAAFGAGTLLAVFLPCGALLLIEGALIIGAGVLLLCK